MSKHNARSISNLVKWTIDKWQTDEIALISPFSIYQESRLNKIRIRQGDYMLTRKLNDPLFKLRCNIGGRTSQAFKRKGYSKTSKYHEMLGVPYEIASAHIERQFTKGMTWLNHGEWHIDHVIPLASADNEAELINLCHYTNLQPLWAKDNLVKNAKIISGTQIQLRM